MPARWQLWQAVTLGLGGLFVFSFMLLFVTPLLLRYRPPIYLTYYQTSLLSELISLACTVLIMTPLLWGMRRRSLEDFLSSVEWNGEQNFAIYVAVGGILATGMHFGGRWWGGVAEYVSHIHLVITLLLYLLSAVLLGPILEEFYFRGALFVSLLPRLGRLYAIVLVTVLFSGIHVGHMIGVLPIAAVLGFVRLRTNSLASCFVLHASYNFFLFCLAVR